MISTHYDVVILGAGPAGLACAIELMQSKLQVLLIEKKAEIGPKICAGGLTNLTKNYVIPDEKTRSFNRQKIVIKDKDHVIELANPIRTITRLELGQYQLQQLQKAQNITVATQTTVQEIQQNKLITTKGQHIQFNYLVGADGSTSLVRKSLQLTSKHCIGLYYNIPEITNECVWYLKYKTLKTGYIWVFPHKEHTNIGIYFNPLILNSKKAREELENYITCKGYSFKPDELKGGPVCYNYERYDFDPVFLAGDAAGLTSKGTGEGISYALISGKEIARKIMDKNYKPLTLNNIIRIKKRQDKLFKILETFPFMHAFLYTVFVQLMRIKSFQAYFGV